MWFQGGLVFTAHRLMHHSTLGSRVIKQKKEDLRRRVAILGAARLGEHREHVIRRELQLAARPLERQEPVEPAV